MKFCYSKISVFNMKFSIRLLYLYLFSFIGLLIGVIGAIRLIQLGINVYVFKGADQYQIYTPPIMPDGKEASQSAEEIAKQKRINEEETTRQRQREVAGASAMLIAGIPLYLYHWKTIQRESK